jgi:hypothetical protein
MVDQEGFSTNIATLFDKRNYAFWTIRMQKYLMEIRFYVWKSFMICYTSPTNPPKNVSMKKPSEHNARANNSILCGLLESEFVKGMPCVTENKIWDKVQNIYEHDEKVNKVKL